MGLFELPVELAQCIFNEWVNDAWSISSMDIACSGSCRDDLLALLRHPQFLLSTDLCGAISSRVAYVRWLSSRRVRVAQLTMFEANVPAIAAINFLSLPAVRELVVIKTSPIVCVVNYGMHRLFSRCPALTSVDLQGIAEDTFLLQVLMGLLATPALPLCKLSFPSNGNFHWELLRSVVFCFRNTLTDLHIRGLMGTGLDNATLQFIGLTCIKLKSFCFSAEKLTATDVISFLNMCGAGLTHVDFGWTPWLQESVVKAIIERLPNAEIVYAATNPGNVTWRALQHALQHCSRLREWFMNMGQDTLCAVIENGAWQLEFMASVNFRDISPFLVTLQYPLSCVNITCANLPEQGIAAFVARHGSTITDLTLVFDQSFPHHDGDGLVPLINGCNCLAVLRIFHFRHFTDALVDLWFAGRVSVLTKLVLCHATAVSCRAFTALTARCPRLEWLDLNGCALVADSFLLTVSTNCPNIETLGLKNCDLISTAGTMRFITSRLTRPLEQLAIPQAIEALVLTMLDCMGAHGQQWKEAVRSGRCMHS